MLNTYEWIILRLVRELMRRPGRPNPEAVRALAWMRARIPHYQLTKAIELLAKERRP